MSGTSGYGTGSYGDIGATLRTDIMRSVTKYQDLRAQHIFKVKSMNDTGSTVGVDARNASSDAMMDLISAMENQARALARRTKEHQLSYNTNHTLASTDRIQADLKQVVDDKNQRFVSAKGLGEELKRLVKRQRIFTYFYVLWLVLAAGAFVYMFFVARSACNVPQTGSPLFQTNAAELKSEGMAWTSTR